MNSFYYYHWLKSNSIIQSEFPSTASLASLETDVGSKGSHKPTLHLQMPLFRKTRF